MWTIIALRDTKHAAWGEVLARSHDYAEIVRAWHALSRKHSRAFFSQPRFNLD